MNKLPDKYGTYAGPVYLWLEKELFTKSPEQRQAVVAAFMDWLREDARVTNVPDLADRILALEPRLRRMAENLSIEVGEGRLVIKSDAESMALLSLFRRGSSWFSPHPGVDQAIMHALIVSAS